MGSDPEVLIVIGPLPSMQCSEFLAQVQTMQITHTWEPAGNLVEPCWPCYLFWWSSGLHATLCTAGHAGRWGGFTAGNGSLLLVWTSSILLSFYKAKYLQGIKSEVNAKCRADALLLPRLFLLLSPGRCIFTCVYLPRCKPPSCLDLILIWLSDIVKNKAWCNAEKSEPPPTRYSNSLPREWVFEIDVRTLAIHVEKNKKRGSL